MEFSTYNGLVDAREIVAEILLESGLTKTALSKAGRMSRSSLDSYLSGSTQPTVGQLTRLADAAGMEISVEIRPKPKVISPGFIAVLEFGELFPSKLREPLVNLAEVWLQASKTPVRD